MRLRKNIFRLFRYPRQSFYLGLLILICSFLLVGIKVNALPNGETDLDWWVELSKKDSRLIEITLDPRKFIGSKAIVSDIKLKVDFFSEQKNLGTKYFEVQYLKLNHFAVNRFKAFHGFNSVTDVKGIVATYYIKDSRGLFNIGSSSLNIDTYYCTPYNLEGDLVPGLIKKGRKFTLENGYHWVFPTLEDNYCVELNEGLIRTDKGDFRPAKGFRWLNKENNKDLRVVPISN